MNVWEKIKKGLSNGAEIITEKTVEWSHLAKLRWEQHQIQKSIEDNYSELGGKVYQLHLEKREHELAVEVKGIVHELELLQAKLVDKEEEIEEFMQKGTVNKNQLTEFKKDLERGDGIIEQFVVEKNTPFIGKKLKDIRLPKNVLISAIVRKEQVIIPDGQTIFQHEDKVTLIGKKTDVQEAIQILTAG